MYNNDFHYSISLANFVVIKKANRIDRNRKPLRGLRFIKLLEQDQTLYSFRHSGAIEIFKRTGSITKLQKAMGHSSINVSLTYLRGLEIAELKEEDMPMV